MSIDADRERLSQAHNLEWIGRKLKATEMVTVYRWNSENVRGDYFILGGLIPPKLVEAILSGEHISSVIENVWPEPTAYRLERESPVKYFRWGVDEDMYGSEPLVICRQFSKMKEDYLEISEEFRLLHNLYHDKETNTYIKIDDAGNETTVVIVKPDKVQIRLQEIRQFLAIKEMYLSILFEFNEYSRYSLEELGLSDDGPRDIKRESKHNGFMCWKYNHYSDTLHQEFQSASWLRGRRLIKPLPKSKSGLGDFAEEPKYVEFIVDVDDNGDEVYYTCNPYKLSHLPEENAAGKLTLVHFDKQVLDKYYNEPSKYTVEDSMLRCASLWSMKIDNHTPDKVCVFLDELGISLPHAEQEHWRAHNIPPEEGMSETFGRRMVKGEWASSDQPDILFKQSYEQLQKACDEHLAWQLLKPLGTGDAYRLKRLRIPVSDEQCDFDDLVQDLQTILIESIDVKGLKRLLPEAERVNLKGKRSIEVLGEVLSFHSVEDVDHRISFLQKLQTLRSKGSGHRKGSDYQKIANYFGVDSLGQREAFAEILKQALDTIEFLTSVVRSGKLSNKNGKIE